MSSLQPIPTITNEPLKKSLGLCKRAGKLICGADQICISLHQKQSVFLVIGSNNASSTTCKKLQNKCDYYKVPLIFTALSGEQISMAVGRQDALSAVAVTDKQLTNLVLSTIDQNQDTSRSQSSPASTTNITQIQEDI